MSNLTSAQPIAKPVGAAKKPRATGELRGVVRVLNRFLKGNRGVFLIAMIMLIAESATSIAAKYPLAYLIDYLDGKQPDLLANVGLAQGFSPRYVTLAALTVAIVAIAILNSLSDSLSEIYLARGGRQLGFNLRAALYSHLQKLSLAFFGRQRTGDLLTRVTGDVTALEEFSIKSLKDIAGSIFILALSLVALFSSSWQIALVALVMVPVLSIVSNYFADRIKAAAKKLRSREGELAAGAQEMLTSIRVIQTYGSGGNQIKRFADLSKQAMDTALHAARLQAWFGGIFNVLQAVTIVFVVLMGVWLVDLKTITIGALIFFVGIIQDMFKPTKRIIKQWNEVGKIIASVERIGEVLDRKPAVEDQPGAVEAPPLKGHVEFNHVSFAYQIDPEDAAKAGAAQPQLRLALKDVSFTIAPGEVVALVGGSGAGKSTVVQLLPRLYDPHMGQILIDGHDIREFTLDSLRARMSMVLQEAILFVGTVAENIAYGRPDATREEIIAAAIQASAHEFIEKLPDGYDTVLSERAANLSGGQRQRLAIARAFIRNTPILILDEPTTGLDAESTDLVLLALRSLMKGKATIIISHDLNLIRNADKIVVIKEGQIEQVGTHRELLKLGGVYADLYHKQFGQAEAEQRAAQPTPDAAPVAEEDEDADPVTPQVFQTLMTQALPKPVSSQAFRTMMLRALPARAASEAAAQGDGTAGEQGTASPAAPTPPATPVAPPKPVARAVPTIPPAPAAPPVVPATQETMLLHPLPEQGAADPADQPTAFKAVGAIEGELPASASPRRDMETQEPAGTVILPALDPASIQPPAAGAQFDPLHSPALHDLLPGLKTAFDLDTMLEYLQTVLFGKANPNYTITECTLGEAALLPGESFLLRYNLAVRDQAAGQVFQALIGARIFRDQLACAVYVRDRLAPLAALMRGREEIAPFVVPVAMLEPLNMAVHAFPIDGELPQLIGATDRQRMVEVFRETLPESLDDRFAVEHCRVELVDYARQDRCTLRYQVEGRRPGARQTEHRTVYGKVFADTKGALAGPVTEALRAWVRAGGYQFAVPQTLAWRSDLRLSLLEAIPGQPLIADALKARLRGKPGVDAGLTLEQMIDACAHVTATLHTSPIRLGRRRTLDDELTTLRQELAPVLRFSPDLGARLQEWMERIETYAEQSDPLKLCFGHGDFTHGQLVIDGAHVGLVDFDSICQAEPALDLGQFLAYLRFAGRKGDRATSGAVIEQLGARFMDAYIAAAGDRLEDAERLRVRVPVYKIISMMRRTIRSWQKFKGSRAENAVAILEEELSCLPELDY